MILSCGTVTDHGLGCALVTCFVLLDACCMFIRQCQADVGDALFKACQCQADVGDALFKACQCQADVGDALFKACFCQVALTRSQVEDRDDRLCRQQVVIEFLGQGVVENGFHVRIFPLWLLGKGVIILILFSSRSVTESKDLSFQGGTGKIFPSKSFSYIWAPQKIPRRVTTWFLTPL